MSATDKLSGYASGFSNLDAATLAANVTADYQLLDKDGVIHRRDDLPGYLEGSRSSATRWQSPTSWSRAIRRGASGRSAKSSEPA